MEEELYFFVKFLEDKIIEVASNFIDTSKIEESYRNADYIFKDKLINKFVTREGEKFIFMLPANKALTGFIPSLKNNLKVVTPFCAFNTKTDILYRKGMMFHELMHLGSLKQEQLGEGNLKISTGLVKTNFINSDNLIEEEQEIPDMEYLNEAMTEFIAKFIYDRSYYDEYNIVSKNFLIYKISAYEKGYFLIAFLLYNYFEKNPKELFEIYFNNDVELFRKVLNKTWGITLEELRDTINYLQKRIYNIFVNYKFKKCIKKINNKNPIENLNILYQYNLKYNFKKSLVDDLE